MFRIYANIPFWLLAGLAMLFSGPSAHAEAFPAAGPPHIAAALLAEGPVAPGGTITLAIAMRPEPGWHGYWLEPGDAGYATHLAWHLPPGAHTGETAYPVPQTLLLAGLMNHVYRRDYALLVPLTVPADATPGTHLSISADAEWLACSDRICVPERVVLHGTVAIAAPGAATPPDPRFDAWRAALPAPLGGTAHFAGDGKLLRIAIPLPASLKLHTPHLFVATQGVIDFAAPQHFARDGDRLVVSLARAGAAGSDSALPASLPMVLSLDGTDSDEAKNPDGLAFTAVPGTVPAGGVALNDDAAAPAAMPLPLLVLAALAGGLLLNIMPCVFPILSLKALSLARAGESEAHARAEGLAYAAGVVIACLGLGALLLSLRAGGEQIGWAFQLQEPGVVALLLVLAVAIAANLLGLYTLAVPGFTQGHANRGAFATGLLAAFVATPCTGPFMASAMGAALLLPVAGAMLLFAALGVGIALPFLAIAFVAPLRRLLPRPGAWMVWFRRAMAVPMALTALALAWLADRVGGTDFAMASTGLALVLLGLLAMVGRSQRRGQAVARRFTLLAGLLALCGMMILPRTVHAPGREQATGILPARAFSDDALAQALASGRPVFVFFTADWCLTCQVNERIAIERASTRDAFACAGVTVLKGDWTRRDPAITRYLTAHGAAGVPLYVWYPGQGRAPRVLPQVLTPDLLAALPAGG